MQFQELIARAAGIRTQYEALEQHRYGRTWTDEEVMLGFLGDVGDLAKLVQAKAGVRDIPELEAKLAHELADCLWSVFVLARYYNVDLEQAFLHTMNEIEYSINQHSETNTITASRDETDGAGNAAN